MRILLSGAAGFVGSHVLEGILQKTDWEIVVIDSLNYASFLKRISCLTNYDESRVKFIWHDLRSPINEYVKAEIGEVDYIAHLAANSSVEDTIKDPLGSVYDNVVGTVNMLEFARTLKNLKLMNVFSTDEVYGPAPDGVNFSEDSPHKPSNPYSAGKAGAEDYAHAYYVTYGLPVFVSNTMNVFGPRQHPEKFVPTVISKILQGETVKMYSNAEKTKAGCRFWIHGSNVADGVLFLLKNAKPGQRYHIVGTECNNLDLAQKIAGFACQPLKYEMVSYYASRPGHDMRYGMSGEKMAKMGWKLELNLEQSLKETVDWYVQNKDWLLMGDK